MSGLPQLSYYSQPHLKGLPRQPHLVPDSKMQSWWGSQLPPIPKRQRKNSSVSGGSDFGACFQIPGFGLLTCCSCMWPAPGYAPKVYLHTGFSITTITTRGRILSGYTAAIVWMLSPGLGLH